MRFKLRPWEDSFHEAGFAGSIDLAFDWHQRYYMEMSVAKQIQKNKHMFKSRARFGRLEQVGEEPEAVPSGEEAKFPELVTILLWIRTR